MHLHPQLIYYNIVEYTNDKRYCQQTLIGSVSSFRSIIQHNFIYRYTSTSICGVVVKLCNGVNKKLDS